MKWITNSKIFKASKYQDKVLAAIKDPINEPLVQQLNSYFEKDEEIKPEKNDLVEATPIHPDEVSENEDHELQDESQEENEEKTEDDESQEENEDETSHVEGASVLSSTYVDVSTVSQAVNDIPGILNLREDTCGVTHVILRSGVSNEFWIYYNSDVDINKVLDSVHKTLLDNGYYFLEFNRVARDENAIVFVINWISNYFNPRGIKEVDNEK